MPVWWGSQARSRRHDAGAPRARPGHLARRAARSPQPCRRDDGRVSEYIYKENGRDWAKVALRLEEAVKVLPYAVPAVLELGNAYLRLGERDKARAAYKKILEQKQMPVDALFAKQIQAQIDRLASDEPLTKMEPIRNPWRE